MMDSQVRSVFAVTVAAVLIAFPHAAPAQIQRDNTLALASRGLALTGPNFAIPSTLGQIQGTNLFHSFSLFNVQTGQSATFSGPPSVTNILTRVTGGSPSTI